ncbi:MAG: DNA topoisomerase-1 [Pseudohongiellaceae bacterium]
MAKQLVIVESPAKAKTIGKFLGKDFTVKASMGHVRDLPKSGLGIDVDNDFETSWEEIKDRTKVLDDLRTRAAKADTIYLATDPDREGEAIAWHLVAALVGDRTGDDAPTVRRVVFHEITEPAIQEAFEKAGEIDYHGVDAYRTRRILDRLLGYQLSPLLWKKLSRGLSAGRVQSVAVRIVVEREVEIRNFVPDEYWNLGARFGSEEEGFRAEFTKLDGEKRKLVTASGTLEAMRRVEPNAAGPEGGMDDQGAAEAIPELAECGPFTITALNSLAKSDRAKPPFITSTLQQAASSRHGFAARRTMRVAQQLYEGMELPGEGAAGLITYMRTDSFNLSNVARQAAAKLIPEMYGDGYLPEKPNAYKSKKGAQEAHEAIRPTDPKRTPDSLLAVLKPEQWKLYDLIWRRFMASQMSPARYAVTNVEFARGGASFEASGRVTLFDGHTRVYGKDRSADQQLPEMVEGQEISADALIPSRHFTKPPRRYSEASLVRSLEKHGIGRPSTYASILSTIVDRKYVDNGEEATEDEARHRMVAGIPDPEPETPETDDDDEAIGNGAPTKKRSRSFHATHLGEVVTNLLIPFFDRIVNTEFTARMESELDRIADGEVPWKKVVEDFYSKFAKDLEHATEKMEPYWDKPLLLDELRCGKVPEDGGPACEAPMAVLFNRFGTYLGCSRYPDCRNILTLTGRARAAAELTDHLCRQKNDKGEVCGRQMERKVNRWGSAFLACTGFKKHSCKGSVSLSKAGEPLWPDETSVPCPDCGAELVVKRSRRGKFLACPRYPKCRGTLSLPSCTHASRTGKLCAKPMTEPVAGGKLQCKTHPEVRLKPPQRKKDDDEEGAKKKATKKKVTKKKVTKKKATAKKATSKKTTKKKVAAKKPEPSS